MTFLSIFLLPKLTHASLLMQTPVHQRQLL